MMVMNAEKIMANIYVLMGDTLQEANATFASISQEEAMMMWHRRLGHMSKRDKINLIKEDITYNII